MSAWLLVPGTDGAEGPDPFDGDKLYADLVHKEFVPQWPFGRPSDAG
jgi:hypothetical protein